MGRNIKRWNTEALLGSRITNIKMISFTKFKILSWHYQGSVARIRFNIQPIKCNTLLVKIYKSNSIHTISHKFESKKTHFTHFIKVPFIHTFIITHSKIAHWIHILDLVLHRVGVVEDAVPRVWVACRPQKSHCFSLRTALNHW